MITDLVLCSKVLYISKFDPFLVYSVIFLGLNMTEK